MQIAPLVFVSKILIVNYFVRKFITLLSMRLARSSESAAEALRQVGYRNVVKFVNDL